MKEAINEQFESKDFLSEKTKFSMKIAKEVADHLPHISDEEMISHVEKHETLVGLWKLDGNELSMAVDYVMEIDDPRIIFRDPKGHEVRIDYEKLKEIYSNLKQENPEYVGMDIVGDVHTHPYTKEQLNGKEPWLPSSTDIENTIENLKSGLIPTDKPYVFGIVTRDTNKEMQIAFYRIIKKENGEYIPKAFNEWVWK